MNSLEAIKRVGKAGPRFLFIDLIPFPAQALHVREAPIDLAGIRTAVEDAQIDFLDAALILLLLLQHGVRHILRLANHQRAVHHEQRLRGHGGRTAVAFGSGGVAEIEQGIKRRQVGAAQRQIDAAAIRLLGIHADAAGAGFAVRADAGIERAAHGADRDRRPSQGRRRGSLQCSAAAAGSARAVGFPDPSPWSLHRRRRSSGRSSRA